MLKPILTYGTIAGLIAGGLASATATIVSHQIPSGSGMAIGYTIMLLALSLIVLAVKRERDEARGGTIGFWSAFGIGLAITLVASVLYALCWEATLTMIGGPGAFIDGYAAALRRGGADAAELRQIEEMRTSYANPLVRFPMTMTEIAPVGILVSLVTAVLLRNPRMLPAR